MTKETPPTIVASPLSDGLDAKRFRFIEQNNIKCGIRENGFWEATSDSLPWVSRKTLAECIDILFQYAAQINRKQAAMKRLDRRGEVTCEPNET
jgi:hypothetical protein